MHMVTKNMASITKALEQSVQSNNLEKIQMTMDRFEKQFENLDMQVSCGALLAVVLSVEPQLVSCGAQSCGTQRLSRSW